MIRTVLLSLLWFGVAQAEPVTYILDASQSTLDARVYKDGVASALAHDHVIRAGGATGSVQFDASAANAWSLNVSVPTADLQVDPWRVRRSYGLTGDIDESDRKEIEGHMRAADQLATDTHKTIAFRSTRIRRVADTRYLVEGDLTLRGVTQTVLLNATIESNDQQFVGQGTLRITHKQFGFKPYSAVMGAVQNKEGLELVLKLVATRTPSPAVPTTSASGAAPTTSASGAAPASAP